MLSSVVGNGMELFNSHMQVLSGARRQELVGLSCWQPSWELAPCAQLQTADTIVFGPVPAALCGVRCSHWGKRGWFALVWSGRKTNLIHKIFMGKSSIALSLFCNCFDLKSSLKWSTVKSLDLSHALWGQEGKKWAILNQTFLAGLGQQLPWLMAFADGLLLQDSLVQYRAAVPNNVSGWGEGRVKHFWNKTLNDKIEDKGQRDKSHLFWFSKELGKLPYWK